MWQGPQIKFKCIFLNLGKLGFPNNITFKFCIDLSQKKKSSFFHPCFPIIAPSIFHLSAINIIVIHYIWPWHTCYSYLEYISIPEFLSLIHY